MDLEFTSEQEELRASVRSFLDKECTTAVVRGVVESGEPPTALWQSMVALDWPALAVPEEHGGIGLSFVETAVVAEELGRCVAPGPILTDNLERAGPEMQRRAGLAMPMRRVGRPDEVAQTVVWLCSEPASFITGAVLPIDGGKLAGMAPFSGESS